MSSKATGRRFGQWHPSVLLNDFVQQVYSLQQIVDMTKTPKLGSFDDDTIKRAMGWGSYIEEVIDSLSTNWQRDMLTRRLTSAGEVAVSPRASEHVASLARLRQARRWVLRSMLGSAFLGDHPKPEALLMWIMTEYAAIPTEKGSPPASTRWGLSTKNDVGREHPRALRSFVEDATEVIKTRGNTAYLSHACSALLACASRTTEAGASRPATGVQTSPSASCGGGLVPSEILETALCRAGQDPSRRRKRERPAFVHEASVETAQKRAYASNCYGVLLSTCNHGDGPRGRDFDGSRVTSFIAQMATLARMDTVVLEVMCLMLVESWKQTMYGKDRDINDWTNVPDSSATTQLQDSALRKLLCSAILQQVLVFRDDARLWSLDAELLADVSHYHFTFADAYLAHLLSSLSKGAMGRLDDGGDVSTTTAPLALESLQVTVRLDALSSRSERLGKLCQAALAQSSNISRVRE